MSPDEWMEQRGSDSVALDDAMRHWTTDPPTVDGEPPSSAQHARTPLMWSADEELVVTTTRPPRSALRSLWGIVRNLAILGALVGLGLNSQQVLAIVLPKACNSKHS